VLGDKLDYSADRRGNDDSKGDTLVRLPLDCFVSTVANVYAREHIRWLLSCLGRSPVNSNRWLCASAYTFVGARWFLSVNVWTREREGKRERERERKSVICDRYSYSCHRESKSNVCSFRTRGGTRFLFTTNCAGIILLTSTSSLPSSETSQRVRQVAFCETTALNNGASLLSRRRSRDRQTDRKQCPANVTERD